MWFSNLFVYCNGRVAKTRKICWTGKGLRNSLIQSFEELSQDKDIIVSRRDKGEGVVKGRKINVNNIG